MAHSPRAAVRVLQNGRLLPSLEAALEQRYDLVPLWQQADPKAFLKEHGGGITALVTSAALGADDALLASLPDLQMIASFGVGYDQLPTDTIRQRGLKASDCVADIAMGLLIDVSRGIAAADRFVRRGDWLKARFPLATKVSGKRLGVLGMGRIGRTIAKRASGFDMEIRYTNRNPLKDAPWAYEPSLTKLAEWADFLVIAAAGGAETRGLVGADVLKALGPEGFLINVARGTVVDEDALTEALVNKRIAGAGLDVFVDEPKAPPKLFGLDNVVMLPHVASATNETRQAMADSVLANLEAWHAGRPLPTPIPGVSA
jgi:hydroxypyruvate reductase